MHVLNIELYLTRRTTFANVTNNKQTNKTHICHNTKKNINIKHCMYKFVDGTYSFLTMFSFYFVNAKRHE